MSAASAGRSPETHLSLAAAKATLRHVLTAEAFERMERLCARLAEGVETVMAERSLPWHVTRLGCRAEYLFGPDRPRNGSEAAAISEPQLDELVHLAMLNRGIILTPFHNMALMSPATTEEQVDAHTAAFAEIASLVLD